jgi:hypothetical protein
MEAGEKCRRQYCVCVYHLGYSLHITEKYIEMRRTNIFVLRISLSILYLHYSVISTTHRALQYMRYAGLIFIAGSKEGMADICHTMKITDKSK